VLQDLIASVRNVRAELKVEPKVKVPVEIFCARTGDPVDDRAEPERAGAAGKCGLDQFAEGALANRAGARSTARFDLLVIYEKKIDVAPSASV